MKKSCLFVKNNIFKFLKCTAAIIIVQFQQSFFCQANNSYPCIISYSCETGECDPIIQKIVVDYYDEFGSQYRWTHKVHIYKELTDCNAAIRDHFPYKYASCKSE